MSYIVNVNVALKVKANVSVNASDIRDLVLDLTTSTSTTFGMTKFVMGVCKLKSLSGQISRPFSCLLRDLLEILSSKVNAKVYVLIFKPVLNYFWQHQYFAYSCNWLSSKTRFQYGMWHFYALY